MLFLITVQIIHISHTYSNNEDEGISSADMACIVESIHSVSLNSGSCGICSLECCLFVDSVTMMTGSIIVLSVVC